MTYEVTTREVGDIPLLSIRDRVAPPEMPTFIGESFRTLFEYLTVAGITASAEPFVIYHVFGSDAVDAEACLPTSGQVAGTDRIISRVLPGATVATTVHVGSYDDLGSAYEALTRWIGDHALEPAGAPRERYLDGPDADIPPEEYRTIVELPIAESVVPVG